MARLPGKKIDTLSVVSDGAEIKAEIRLVTEGGVPSFYAVPPKSLRERRSFEKRFDLSIALDLVEVGTREDGKKIHRSRSDNESEYYGRRGRKVIAATDGLAEVGELSDYGGSYHQSREVVAMVKATPENFELIRGLFSGAFTAAHELGNKFLPRAAEGALRDRVGLTVAPGVAVVAKKAKRRK